MHQKICMRKFMAHSVIVQSWTLCRCSAAVEYVVIYPLGGILPVKKNEQATGTCKIWMCVIKMFIEKNVWSKYILTCLYGTDIMHVCWLICNGRRYFWKDTQG